MVLASGVRASYSACVARTNENPSTLGASPGAAYTTVPSPCAVAISPNAAEPLFRWAALIFPSPTRLRVVDDYIIEDFDVAANVGPVAECVDGADCRVDVLVNHVVF